MLLTGTLVHVVLVEQLLAVHGESADVGIRIAVVTWMSRVPFPLNFLPSAKEAPPSKTHFQFSFQIM